MPLTLEQARKLLVGRLKGTLTMAGLSTVTEIATANLDLDAPIAAAAEAVGVAVADLTAPTDIELASVPGSSRLELIDRAMLNLLLAIRGNWNLVTYSLDGRSESLSDLLTSLDRLIADQRAAVRSSYGVGQAMLLPGRIRGGSRSRWWDRS